MKVVIEQLSEERDWKNNSNLKVTVYDEKGNELDWEQLALEDQSYAGHLAEFAWQSFTAISKKMRSK